METSMRLRLCLMFAASMTLLGCGEAENDDDCVDSECTTPPAPSCQDGLAITYDAVGSCVSDRCAYEATTTTCDAGCNGSVCANVAGDGSGSDDGSGDGSGDGTGT